MARHYYLTRSGRLRRKDNTLCFEPSAEAEQQNGAAKKNIEELFTLDTSAQALPAEVNPPVDEMDDEAGFSAPAQDTVEDAPADEMGDLALEPEAVPGDETLAGPETDATADTT